MFSFIISHFSPHRFPQIVFCIFLEIKVSIYHIHPSIHTSWSIDIQKISHPSYGTRAVKTRFYIQLTCNLYRCNFIYLLRLEQILFSCFFSCILYLIPFFWIFFHLKLIFPVPVRILPLLSYRPSNCDLFCVCPSLTSAAAPQIKSTWNLNYNLIETHSTLF